MNSKCLKQVLCCHPRIQASDVQYQELPCFLMTYKAFSHSLWCICVCTFAYAHTCCKSTVDNVGKAGRQADQTCSYKSVALVRNSLKFLCFLEPFPLQFPSNHKTHRWYQIDPEGKRTRYELIVTPGC